MAHPSKQEGAALITVLIMLIIITLFSITATRVSTMELSMANNKQATVVAYNRAQALSDAIFEAPDAFIVTGEVGDKQCTKMGDAQCFITSILITDSKTSEEVDDSTLYGEVRRLGPALRPPPRAIGSSADKFMAAAFEVRATYDDTDENQGRYTLSEGVTVLVPIN